MRAGSQTFTFNTKCKIVAVFLLCTVLIYFKFYLSDNVKDDFADLSEKVVRLPDIPASIADNMKFARIHVVQVNVTVNNISLNIFVTKCLPLQNVGPTVVFLHGAGRTSSGWDSLKSLHLCASMGFPSIALDLPGWGNSRVKLSLEDRVIINRQFLAAFFKELEIVRPVIISPSMSGHFSINYMMEPDPNTCSERLLGLIALAPVRTNEYTHSQYHKCNVPTAIVFGSLDNSLGLTSTNNLRNMPQSEIFIIKEGPHAWYYDRPDEWNKILYHFLMKFSRKIPLESVPH